MRAKQLFLLTLLIAAAFCQSISLQNWKSGGQTDQQDQQTQDQGLQPQDPGYQGQDQQQGLNQQAPNQDQGYQGLQKQSGSPDQEEQQGPQEKPPCTKNAPDCGVMKSFNTKGEYQAFLDEYTKQPDMVTSCAPGQCMSSGPAPAHSETNNQVENVDEADILKNDGNYIYTLSNNILSIIQAYPPNQSQIISSVNLKGINATAMFLQGDYLAVFGSPSEVTSARNTSTTILIYDISDRSNPNLVRMMALAGQYVNARKLANGFMYLATSYSLTRGFKVQPWFNIGFGITALGYTYAYWIPQYKYSVPKAVNIISFDLSSPLLSKKNIATIFTEARNIIYMSQRHIYFASSSYDQRGIFTKIIKVFVYGNYIQPMADGQVRGAARNQFYLDQYGGYLRIATSTTSSPSSNFVSVLDYRLRIAGFLDDVAPNYVISSCRFAGNRLYLSTTGGPNPFYTIGFNYGVPVVVGQLKVSGVYTYLHPYDQDTIIALGRQTDKNGQKLGLKITVFDVSNVLQPKQTANLDISEKYAESYAEFEHKAFLFSADKHILIIPGRMNNGKNRFNGVFAFYISKTRVSLQGMIDHLQNAADNYDLRNVERSLWIQSTLYTKSQCLLKVNKINKNFDKVKDIRIPCN